MNADKKIRVLGKGLTAQAIKEKFDDVILYDESDFHTYDKSSSDITVVSPGIPPSHDMVNNANNIMSDYDLFASSMPFSIWISGTNGKTTTTQMIQHLLENKGSVYGGNIGVPISSMDTDAPIWILETSSFTAHYVQKAKPSVYILLPISEDHISWHGSYEAYQQAKLRPLDFMHEGEIAIIPEKYKEYSTNAYKITYKNSDDLCEHFNINKDEVDFKEPFLLDALMALACERILFDTINVKKINEFKVDAHKVEEFLDKQNRLWVDDSKATNVDATMNALIPYKSKEILLILGGDDKKAQLEPLFENLKMYSLKVFTIGSNFQRLNQLCEAYDISYESCERLDNAVDKIHEKHHENSIAMLSPAAASLDQFASYKERGEKFKQKVLGLSLN
jgi:UDP-N-acetylmuramoylalanine--D-glutamate ligase